MSYHYEATPEEQDAAALLKRSGWNVQEPRCPLCHGMGTVGKSAEWGRGATASVSWSATPCPNGCPVPTMFYYAAARP